jgi:lantibiotic modifying enzyme
MIPSAAKIDSIAKLAEARPSKRSADRLRRMLAGLGTVDPGPPRQEALEQLCEIGVSYAWRELERTGPSALLERTSAEAQANLRQYLQGTLEWITRPCFDLEWSSYTLALEALGLVSPGALPAKEKFLGSEPLDRLFSFFKRFPVLAGLWSVSIHQWRRHATEILARAAADDRAIARAFFDATSCGRITDLRIGLSDRHKGGRSVALVEFERGLVIYKPRTGTSEVAWASLLRSMNKNGFRPLLKNARVLRRRGYHWMEYIGPARCPDVVAIRRFYKRLGGLIAAAYLSNAVDCHRENLIAAGEHPVLVDLDALWHVSSVTKTQSSTDLLYRTGFFPNSNPESLQSRSSALGKTETGTHLAKVGARRQSPADYADEIVDGFTAGWHCLVGTSVRRAVFQRRLGQIRSQERRWIYFATEKYAAIIRASVQPGALSSGTTRLDVIRRLCERPTLGADTAEAEIDAMERLDIPYFTRRTKERMPRGTGSPPAELLEAIRKALEWTR